MNETTVRVQEIQDYRTPFRRWDQCSWIRSKPVTDDSLEGGAPFPASIVPLAAHPEVASCPERKNELLAYRALAHLEFTTLLELEHVNAVCKSLAQGEAPVTLTLEQRHDALRIYCDEGGHALIVELLAKRLEALHQIDRRILGRPRFDQIISRLLEERAREIPPHLIRYFFVTVSETLITKLLSEIPNDHTVVPAVRAVLRDHASDEAHHREYFRWLFPKIWAALSTEEKVRVGCLLPEFLWAFLGPDRALDFNILRAVGFTRRSAARIIRETYDAQTVAAHVRQAAKPTLKLFEDAGVLSDPLVMECFLKHRLLSRSSPD
jgi:hypothetical protein